MDTVTRLDSLALHKVTEIRKLNSPYLETSKVLHQKTEVILPKEDETKCNFVIAFNDYIFIASVGNFRKELQKHTVTATVYMVVLHTVSHML